MSSTASPYLLLFRGAGSEVHQQLSPEHRQQLTEQWNAWIDGLVARGTFQQGHPLAPAGKVLSGPGGARITDGPFAEAKEVVGGYIIVQAAGLEAAADLARGCPGLLLGMTVEVRPLLDRSPALEGVRARPAAGA